jgi:hypothetical protein
MNLYDKVRLRVGISKVGGKFGLIEGCRFCVPISKSVEDRVMALKQASSTSATELNPEQQEHAERILQHLRATADRHLQELAVLLASKPDNELFGQTEFQARDILHRIGAQAIQAAVDERQKRGVPGC